MGDCCGTYNHLLWLYPVRRSYRLFRSYEVNTSLLLWNLWEMFLQDYMSAICNRGLKDDTHHDTPAVYYNMIHNSKIKKVLSNYLHIWPQLNLYWLSTYQFLMNAYIVLFLFLGVNVMGIVLHVTVTQGNIVSVRTTPETQVVLSPLNHATWDK